MMWHLSPQAIVAAIAASVFIYGFRPLLRWKYRKIPGPPPMWLIGNLLDVLRMSFPKAAQHWRKQYGPVFKVFQGAGLLVVVEDPNLVRAVNTRNHWRPPFPSLTSGVEKRFDDAGMLSARGPYVQSQRMAWAPFFAVASLREFAVHITTAADRLCAVLETAAEEGREVEMWRLFGALTMEVVGGAAFGVDLHTLGEDEATQTPQQQQAMELIDACKDVFAFSGIRSSIYGPLAVLFPFTAGMVKRLAAVFPDPPLANVMKARRRLRALCAELIRETRARDAQADGSANGTANGKHDVSIRSGCKPGSFLDLLIHATNKETGKPFTDMEITAQGFTFLLAGYETTANALAFTTYLLAANPDKEAKMMEEIDAFGRDATPGYDDLVKFPYVDAVLKEALRMEPPAGFGTLRELREDMDIGGYQVPKGTAVLTAQYSFHHNPEYWPEPEKFQPERFLGVSAVEMPQWAPFGDGGRNCVGMKLAVEEAKLTLIRIYQRFTLRLTPGQVPLVTKTVITTSPKDGVHVTVRKR